MINLLEEIVGQSISEIRKLGDSGRKNIQVEGAGDHSRNCAAEQAVYEIARRVLKERLDSGSASLLVEGFPVIGKPFETDYTFILDPIDGTAYFARQKSRNPPAISIPISAVKSREGTAAYADVSDAVIGDVVSGEIWKASLGGISESNLTGRLIAGANEGVHDPVLASDFYFPENAQARLKLQHPTNPKYTRFENLNIGSVAEMMALVATGDLTAFYNMVGPTPWELAPGYRLIKQAGGHVLSADDGKELGERPFRLDEKRIPVIAAYNEETARKMLEQIRS